MIKGIVFLGNPGKEYEKSRHNLGWMLVPYLSFSAQLHWEKKFNGLYASYVLGGEKRILLKPGLFMNRSGESVLAFVQFFKFAPVELLVVHDELEMDFLQFNLKRGGGAAGHNGLRSLTGCLGSSDFIRMRLGISRPAFGAVSAYVLSRFTPDEEIQVPGYLEKAAGFMETALAEGL